MNEEVSEAKCNGTEIEYVEKSPYYDKIKKQLEIVMRQKDMHGFRSLRACYLYEKGKQEELAAQNLRKQANELNDLVTKAQLEVPIAIHLTEAKRLKEKAEVVELEYSNSYEKISLHKTNPNFTPKNN